MHAKLQGKDPCKGLQLGQQSLLGFTMATERYDPDHFTINRERYTDQPLRVQSRYYLAVDDHKVTAVSHQSDVGLTDALA